MNLLAHAPVLSRILPSHTHKRICHLTQDVQAVPEIQYRPVLPLVPVRRCVEDVIPEWLARWTHGELTQSRSRLLDEVEHMRDRERADEPGRVT
jgi:hypothetical protein